MSNTPTSASSEAAAVSPMPWWEHPWFEAKRTPGATQAEIDEAEEMSKVIFGTVSFPDGAIKITADPLRNL